MGQEQHPHPTAAPGGDPLTRRPPAAPGRDRQVRLALGWVALACAAVVLGGPLLFRAFGVETGVDAFGRYVDPVPLAVAAVAIVAVALVAAIAVPAASRHYAGIARAGRLAALPAFALSVWLDAAGLVALLGSVAWLVGDLRLGGPAGWGQLAAPAALVLLAWGGYDGWIGGASSFAGLAGLVASAAALWLDAWRGSSVLAAAARLLLPLLIAAVLLFVLILFGGQ